MAEQPDLLTRPATDDDMPYVLATWVRSYGSRIPSKRRQKAVSDFRKRYVDRFLRLKANIKVLCSPSSPATLHGYVVEHDGAIAWLYVIKDLRGLGLAKKLIKAALGSYPERMTILCEAPFRSSRFVFTGHQLRPSTSQGEQHVQGNLCSVSP